MTLVALTSCLISLSEMGFDVDGRCIMNNFLAVVSLMSCDE